MAAIAKAEPVKARIQLPPKMVPLFAHPRGSLRYRCAHGGRGSGKSRNFAMMALVWGYKEKLRILCTRQFQVTIKESFYAELVAVIESVPWLAHHYTILEKGIRGRNGTEFIFRGLQRNLGGLKSTSAVDLCIVEEAEDVGAEAWRKLPQTIRAPKSEIWVVWNPEIEGSATDTRFIRNTPRRCEVLQLNADDNPWFPDELKEERENDREALDDATFQHIWHGDYLRNSDKQVLGGKYREAEFTPGPDWSGPYHGLDFGFANDPTAGIRCWVYERRLYVEYEAGQKRLELDATADYLKERIPGLEDYIIRADSARPESISFLERNGLPRIESVDKWPGSVKDGIQHLRAYKEIIVHPRCQEFLKECRLYSYKVDKATNEVLADPVDAYNHYMDALRYALAPLIQAGRAPMDISMGVAY